MPSSNFAWVLKGLRLPLSEDHKTFSVVRIGENRFANNSPVINHDLANPRIENHSEWRKRLHDTHISRVVRALQKTS